MPSHAPQNFRRILSRNLALPLALAVLSAAVFLGLIAYLMHGAGWVEHTDQVLTRAYVLQARGLEMESSARGFLLSGDDRQLQGFQRAAEQDSLREELRKLVSDSPAQVARLDRLQGLMRQWTAVITPLVEARRQDANYRAPEEQITAAQRLRGATADEFNDFVAIERRLRVERLEAANRDAIIIAVTFVVLMLAVGGVLAWRGRTDLLGLSAVFDKALDEQRRQSELLQAQGWLREGQALLSDRLAGEQQVADVGRGALEFLAGYLEARVGAL
ncbi:MAG TPA: CHASE3 domain-containing protein, partial [Ramlibacter sp.]